MFRRHRIRARESGDGGAPAITEKDEGRAIGKYGRCWNLWHCRGEQNVWKVTSRHLLRGNNTVFMIVLFHAAEVLQTQRCFERNVALL